MKKTKKAFEKINHWIELLKHLDSLGYLHDADGTLTKVLLS